MQKIKIFKFILARITLCIVLFTVSVPCLTSYASTAGTNIDRQTNQIIESILNDEQYKQKDNPDDTEENEESKTQRDALATALRTKIAAVTEADNDTITINKGITIINDVCAETKGVKKVFRNAWANNYTDQAKALGIPAATVTDVIEKGLAVGSSTEQNDVIKKAASNINYLKWSGNQGVMENMMMALDANTTFTTYLIALGYAMCVAFSCMALSEQVVDRKFSTESMTMTLLKMCIGLWVINNSAEAVGIMVQWGGILIDKFTVTLSDEEIRYALFRNALASSLAQTVMQLNPISEVEADMMTNLVNFAKDTAQAALGVVSILNPVEGLGRILMDGVTEMLGNGIIQLVSSFTIYSVIVEIMVRGIFVPIAVADLYNDTLRSSAVKYLKKILALCMTGVVMYAIIFAASRLKNEMGTFNLLGRAAINMTMLGMMARARSIAEDIVGAH